MVFGFPPRGGRCAAGHCWRKRAASGTLAVLWRHVAWLSSWGSPKRLWERHLLGYVEVSSVNIYTYGDSDIRTEKAVEKKEYVYIYIYIDILYGSYKGK